MKPPVCREKIDEFLHEKSSTFGEPDHKWSAALVANPGIPKGGSQKRKEFQWDASSDSGAVPIATWMMVSWMRDDPKRQVQLLLSHVVLWRRECLVDIDVVMRVYVSHWVDNLDYEIRI